MLVTMSDKELRRINVIQSVVEKRMRRRDAAHQLALTERQTQPLMNRFRESGAAGLSNLRRGRPGNHRLPESLKLRVLSLLHDHYSDFGPTLAAEKLRERHNITVSVETLRKWMTADGLWVPYSRRWPRVHQPRYRRDCLGELVQIDGSPHDWFEGRAPKCCLLVFIDDATGRLMHLRFGETESAFDYMMATREYLEQHGTSCSSTISLRTTFSESRWPLCRSIACRRRNWSGMKTGRIWLTYLISGLIHLSLTDIGYLTYEEKFKRVNGKREFYFHILKRDPDLGEPVRRALPSE